MANFVSVDHEQNKVLLKNLFAIVGAFGAVWIVFHLTCVFFFGFIMESPLFVGIFLGVGNLWAMLIDVPMGTLQKYFRAKHLITTAVSCIIVASIIFLYFVYLAQDIDFSSGGIGLFTSSVNILLLLLVGLLYGTAKEMYDVSNLSYMMNHIDPDEYGKNLSKNNIATGIGSVAGLVLSIIIMSFVNDGLQIVLFLLIFIAVCVIVFIQFFFDDPSKEVGLDAVKNLKIHITPEKLGNIKEYTKKTISVDDFKEVKKNAETILLKPVELKNSIDFDELVDDTKKEFDSLLSMVAYKSTRVKRISWLVVTVLLFGFWDTIVVTFLVDFLNTALKEAGVDNIIRSGFILIGLLAVPVFTLQIPFINLAKKVGYHKIILLGLSISGVALLCFSIPMIPNWTGILIVIGIGLFNSTGYAAGMPLAQSIFAENYNLTFAKRNNLTTINAHASAGPLKILINFANSIGLFFGGAIIAGIGFRGMFIIYGLLVLGWAFITFTKKKEWDL